MPDNVQINIDFGGFDDVVKRGIDVASYVKREALLKGAQRLRDLWMVYPPVRRRKVDTSRWSDKQRRGFFAKLNAGEINVPYVRTSKMRRGFFAKLGTGLSAVVGNDAAGSEFVLSNKRQSWYHRGNWLTESGAKKRYGPEAANIVKIHVIGYLQG